MTGTSCLEQFGAGPMFVELEASPFVVSVVHEGKPYDVGCERVTRVLMPAIQAILTHSGHKSGLAKTPGIPHGVSTLTITWAFQ